MRVTPDEIAAVKPRLIETTYGKWLAVSRPRSAFRFGVIGDTEEDATHRFAEARDAWCAIAARPDGVEDTPAVL